MTFPDGRRSGLAAAAAVLLILVVAWAPWDSAVTLTVAVVLLAAVLAALLLPTRGGGTPARPAPSQPSPREAWDRAVRAHREVLDGYAAYELDPAMLLRYPAMWDLRATAIIDFHDALSRAGELASDDYPGDDGGHEYIAAVRSLRSAWAAADTFARSTGVGELPEPDAKACRRALKLLNHADGTGGPERVSYLEEVLATVDGLTERGVVAPPVRIREELTLQVQRALEA